MREYLLSNFEVNDDYDGYGGDSDDVKEKDHSSTDREKRNWKSVNYSRTEE